MDDIYTAAGGYMSTDGSDGMETKQVLPGYVPAPVVNADVVEREPADDASTDKAGDEKSTTKGSTGSTAKGSGTTASK